MPHIVLYDEIQMTRLRFIESLFTANPFPVLNLRPKERGLIPFDDGVDLLNIYDLPGDGELIVTLHTVPGDLCILDWLMSPVQTCPEFCFDVLISGKRGPEQVSLLGKVELVNPLHNWTDDDLWTAIRELNLPYDVARYEHCSMDHLNILKVCSGCLQGGPQIHCKQDRGSHLDSQ